MVHLIDSILDENHLVVVRRTLAFARAFYHPIANGVPLTPELIKLAPSTIYIDEPINAPLLDIFDASGVWVINAQVRNLIEKIEPRIHQFIRIPQIESESGRQWQGYSMLYIGQAVDAIVIEETSFRDGNGRPGFSIAPVLNKLRGCAVLDRKRVQGLHLWRGGRAIPGHAPEPFFGYTFCSDRLATAITESGAHGWRFLPCKLSE